MPILKALVLLIVLTACVRRDPDIIEEIKGDPGTPGVQGPIGTNGVSVVFTSLPASTSQCSNGGTTILLASDTNRTGVYDPTDANQQAITTCNGTNGTNGVDAPAPRYSVITPIQACGAASSPWKEVLLCLADGEVLSSFSETMAGQDTRLSFIPNGSYVDTDESNCSFTVSSDSTGNHTVSWTAGSNSYATWLAGSATCTVE